MFKPVKSIRFAGGGYQQRHMGKIENVKHYQACKNMNSNAYYKLMRDKEKEELHEEVVPDRHTD